MKVSTTIADLKKIVLWNRYSVRIFYAFGIYRSRLKRKYQNLVISEYWQGRIDKVCERPDNALIPKVVNAGKIIDDIQFRHNGIRINFGSDYGMEMVRRLEINSGIHEPQEERVFAEVLKKIPENATLIELGSYWSFYSMWFNKKIKGAKNYMVEPDYFCYLSGIFNFKLNRMNGMFTRAFVSSKSSHKGNPVTICNDDFSKEKSIDFIHLLPCDIQGYEYEISSEAKKLLDVGKIVCLFISTHSEVCIRNVLTFFFSTISGLSPRQTLRNHIHGMVYRLQLLPR